MTQGIDPRTFAIDAKPLLRERNIISGDRWRIGIITAALVRFEWSDSGAFEDRPTQMAYHRDFGEDVPFTLVERDGRIIIDTGVLTIAYDRRPFSKEGLSVVVKGVPFTQFNTWHYGDEPRGNMRGTARTLDEADGPVPLDLGVVSRDGWAVLDDSASNVLQPAETVNGKPNPFGTWVTPRDHPETDLYFFGYGHHYIDAVQAFYRLTGPQPLLPRFALGNWWSRYYRYTQNEYLALMDRFKAEGIPFTTSVIDMDWHLVDDVDPKYGIGWTEYTWNERLFPDHAGFLADLHRRGLHTTLNVHPRDGVRAFEKPYEQVGRAVGVDVERGEAVEFDLTNPRFVEAYLGMHHDLEADGVDFWWVDWQQGGVTRQPGLDPLWMLNHMHYLDSGRDGRWPMTFSRYAGPGSHRYPVGFSGDSVITWDTLKFQPYFTATASNIGYGWWSHDIGGHMLGYRDEELEARWYQFGAFSPINRLHSSNSPFTGKEPWNYETAVRKATAEALRLRHMMLPYLYTMNHRAAEQDRPLIEPMYWQSPESFDAYEMGDEYRFGTELLVAPIVEPNDAAVRRGKADVWLPQGEWFDFFDGRRYASRPAAGRRIAVWRTIDRIPVFAKAGGIVPLQNLGEGDAVNSIDNPQSLRVLVFPGADGRFVLREDDGRVGSPTADTELTWRWRDDRGASVFAVAAVQGDAAAVPQRRDWNLVFRGVAPLGQAACVVTVGGADVIDGAGMAADNVTLRYDAATLSLRITVRGVPAASSLSVTFPKGLTVAEDPVVDDARDVLLHAQMYYLTKEKVYAAVRDLGAGAISAMRTLELEPRNPGDFIVSHMPESVMSALEEVLLRGIG